MFLGKEKLQKAGLHHGMSRGPHNHRRTSSLHYRGHFDSHRALCLLLLSLLPEKARTKAGHARAVSTADCGLFTVCQSGGTALDVLEMGTEVRRRVLLPAGTANMRGAQWRDAHPWSPGQRRLQWSAGHVSLQPWTGPAGTRVKGYRHYSVDVFTCCRKSKFQCRFSRFFLCKKPKSKGSAIAPKSVVFLFIKFNSIK